VQWVRFLRQRHGASFNFEKVSKRTHLDIASVNTAMSVTTDSGVITRVALAAGGVGPIPMRLPATEAGLVGRPPNAAAARAAAAAARQEVSPISDVRGSAAYKRLLLQHLVLAHFSVLFGLDKGLLEVPA
jgi:xanthine dehydrogenase small subunit